MIALCNSASLSERAVGVEPEGKAKETAERVACAEEALGRAAYLVAGVEVEGDANKRASDIAANLEADAEAEGDAAERAGETAERAA